jgi:hypothetical protein
MLCIEGTVVATQNFIGKRAIDERDQGKVKPFLSVIDGNGARGASATFAG